MSALPTGTVTFLLSDLEDSSRLWEQQRVAMREALARHDALAQEVVAAHDGALVKPRGEGDSLFCAFARAADAVAAAAALQRAFCREPWPSETCLSMRIALHTGEADWRDGDYYGPPVNRCGRLRGLAHGGQILLSSITRDLVADRLPPSLSLRDLGRHRLKDLAQPEHVFQLLHPDLPADFPRLRSLDARPHNLPIQLSSFVGRETEMAEAARLLRTTRLLTLTGAGGAGKTRLALQTAAEQMDDYPSGVFLVELAPLAEPPLLVHAVAQVLGVRETPGRPLTDALIKHLHSLTLLLILDNCEHLVGPCAHLTDTLLRACPDLRVLATSRERLQIGGECAWTVPLLSIPDARAVPTVETLAPCASVALFVERAQAVLPSFALSPDNAAAVAQICRRLDGIPLALELAAARVYALAPAQIAQRLGDVFRLLTRGSRTGLTHHQTLRAMLDWSYDMLDMPEQRLLQRLSVFMGGWTLEAAEEICCGEGIEAEDVLDGLDSLAKKSLVQAEDSGDQKRYRLLETLRQYGEEKLHESGDLERMRGEHRDWFLHLAERAETQHTGPEQAGWLNRLETEHENLRAALKWSVEPATRLRLASALHRFWWLRGYLNEGRSWLEGALARRGDASPSVQANALNGAGILAWAQTDFEAAAVFYQKSLALQQQLGDSFGIAKVLNNLAMVAEDRGDFATALGYYEQSLPFYRAHDDTANIVSVLINLGGLAYSQGDLATAHAHYQQCLSLSEGLHNSWTTATVLFDLGMVARDQGDEATAHAHFRQSLLLRRELEDKPGIAASLLGLAELHKKQGQFRHALWLFGAAESARETLGAALPPRERDSYAQKLAALRAEMGEAVSARLHQRGRAAAPEQALRFALATDDDDFLCRQLEDP